MMSHVLIVAIVCLQTFIYHADCDQPTCTKSRKGVPACNFDIPSVRMCGWKSVQSDKNDPTWKWVKPGGKGPIDVNDQPPGIKTGGYIYTKRKLWRQASIENLIGESVKGMCMKFRYATFSENDVTVYSIVDGKKDILYKLKARNTKGKWEQFGVSCCIKAVSNGKSRKIGFTSGPTWDAVAFDLFDITLSDNSCGENIYSKGLCTLLPMPTLLPPPSTTEPPSNVATKEFSTTHCTTTKTSSKECTASECTTTERTVKECTIKEHKGFNSTMNYGTNK